ncbi:MAG: hypothetical protein RR980_02245 [Mucinivorans sp.]
MKKLLKDSDLGLPQESAFDQFVVRLVKSIVGVNQLNALYDSIDGQGADFARNCLTRLKIESQWSAQSLANIPQAGAFIAVANLPHGVLDGLLLMSEVMKKRPDTRIITGFAPSQIAAVADCVISVDTFEHDNLSNLAGLRKAKLWLAAGHALIVFPAQKIAASGKGRSRAIESAWSQASLKFLFNSHVPLIPIHISGHNSMIFRLLGRINPKLQFMRMAHELLDKEGRDFTIEVGSAINLTQMERLASSEELEAYIRTNIMLLGSRTRINSRAVDLEHGATIEKQSSTIEQITAKRLGEYLTVQNYIITSSGISFYVVPHAAIDAIDPRYASDKVNPADQYIIGINDAGGRGVCMAEIRYGDQSMLEHGIDGLYTHAYFEYSHKYFDIIRRSIELGERQVAEEYLDDKNLSSLIWRSALFLLARQEQYRYLIGTSGIASDYSNMAKLMIATYIHAHAENKDFVQMALARHSAKRFHRPLFEGGMIEHLKDLDLVNKLIADADPNYNEMPRTLETLLRQGAHVLSLSTNHLDKSKLNALMIVDIEELRKKSSTWNNS